MRSDFFYVSGKVTARFVRIGQAMKAGKALPPIDVYKLKRLHRDGAPPPVSEYYVVNGHHRVAMARKLGQDYLDANVVEYTAPGAAPESPAASGAPPPSHPADPTTHASPGASDVKRRAYDDGSRAGPRPGFVAVGRERRAPVAPDAASGDFASVYPIQPSHRGRLGGLFGRRGPHEERLAHALRGVPLFREAPARDLVAIWRKLTVVEAPGRRDTLHQRDPGDRLYMVQSGELEVRLGPDPESTIRRAGPGDFVGEMALLTGRPRSADVVAGHDAVLWALDRADFQALVARSLPLIMDSTRRSATGSNR